MGRYRCNGPFVAHVLMKLCLENPKRLASYKHLLTEWLSFKCFVAPRAYLSHKEPFERVPGFEVHASDHATHQIRSNIFDLCPDLHGECCGGI